MSTLTAALHVCPPLHRSRIGIRILIGQYLALKEKQQHASTSTSTITSTSTSSGSATSSGSGSGGAKSGAGAKDDGMIGLISLNVRLHIYTRAHLYTYVCTLVSIHMHVDLLCKYVIHGYVTWIGLGP